MRRLVFLLVLASATLLVSTAFGATILGSGKSETLRGTPKGDVLNGRGGNDVIYGLAGNDRISGGPGRDRVYCGRGVDRVQADLKDVVAKDCEIVARPVLIDNGGVVQPPPPSAPPPPPPAPPLGSRTNPHPVGSIVAVKNWTIRVNSVYNDATSLVLARNQFNDPPAPGNVFFMVNISMTYIGTSPPSELPYSDVLDLGVVGSNGAVYKHYRESCGVIPDDFPDTTRVFTNGTVAGNLCWEVPDGEVLSLQLYHDDSVFWALR